jgi:uncharacterized protein YcsI (UPF0317 family)
MKDLHLSNGTHYPSTVVQIWEDLHSERAGYFRAFQCESVDSTCGCPVIGYCSPGGSHKTIRAVVAEVRQHYPNERCYRNGREVYPLGE